jgi:hypothetical protein
MPPGFWMIELGYLVLALGVPAIIGAALYRVILHDERPSSFVYFRFGKVEFFLILAQIVLGLILVFYFVVFGLGLGILAAVVSSAMPDAVAPVSLALTVAFALFVIWFIIRFMLWPPTIVDTGSFAFMETTRVTAGNFWRLFGLVILIIIGSLLLSMGFFILLGIIVGPEAIAQLKIPTPTPDQSPEASLQAVTQFMQSLFALVEKNAIPLGITWYVLTIIVNGMGVGLLGYAYKSIKGNMGEARAEAFA